MSREYRKKANNGKKVGKKLTLSQNQFFYILSILLSLLLQ